MKRASKGKSTGKGATKKEAVPAKTERPKKLADVLKAATSAGVRLMTGGELESPQRIRRPTGIPSLDYAIAGGLPGAALSHFHGPPSVGKTWAVFHTIATLQRILGDDTCIVLGSACLPHDMSFARLHGVRVPYANQAERDFFISTYASLHRSPPSDAEVELAGKKVGNIFVLAPEEEIVSSSSKGKIIVNDKPLERMFQTIVDISRSRRCQLVVMDDIGGSPVFDKTADEGKKFDWFRPLDENTKPAVHARLLTKWVSRMAVTFQSIGDGFNATSVLAVSQVRVNFDSQYGGTIPVSCKGMDHTVATGVKFSFVSGAGGKVKAPWGVRSTKWEVFRGKYGHPEGAMGTYDFSAACGVDAVSDLFSTAAENGVVRVVEQDNGAFCHFEEDAPVEGATAFKDKLDADPEFYTRVYTALIQSRYPGVRYR